MFKIALGIKCIETELTMKALFFILFVANFILSKMFGPS